MRSDRACADKESFSYLAIGQATRNQSQDLPFALREVGRLRQSPCISFSGIWILVRSEQNGGASELYSVAVPEWMLINPTIIHFGPITTA